MDSKNKILLFYYYNNMLTTISIQTNSMHENSNMNLT